MVAIADNGVIATEPDAERLPAGVRSGEPFWNWGESAIEEIRPANAIGRRAGVIFAHARRPRSHHSALNTQRSAVAAPWYPNRCLAPIQAIGVPIPQKPVRILPAAVIWA